MLYISTLIPFFGYKLRRCLIDIKLYLVVQVSLFACFLWIGFMTHKRIESPLVSILGPFLFLKYTGFDYHLLKSLTIYYTSVYVNYGTPYVGPCTNSDSHINYWRFHIIMLYKTRVQITSLVILSLPSI